MKSEREVGKTSTVPGKFKPLSAVRRY